jgi:hypothetical protein
LRRWSYLRRTPVTTAAGKNLHDDAPRFRAAFGLHAYIAAAAAQAIVHAVGAGKGGARGKEKGGEKEILHVKRESVSTWRRGRVTFQTSFSLVWRFNISLLAAATMACRRVLSVSVRLGACNARAAAARCSL